ncbi:MAG: CPBP family intramembrane glutamic endopeptidase [Candidatus Paceibacterota bacterium]
MDHLLWKRVFSFKDVIKTSLFILALPAATLITLYFVEVPLKYATLIFETVFILSIIAVFFIYAHKKKIPLSKLGFNKIKHKFRWMLISLVLGLFVIFIGGGLAAWVDEMLEIGRSEQLTLPDGMDNNWLLFLHFQIFIGVLIPIAEEIYFRGLIFRYLRQYKPFIFSALLSSFIFAVLHIHPSLMIFAFILGLTSALVYEKSGNIIPALLVHIIVNSTVVNVFLLSQLS